MQVTQHHCPVSLGDREVGALITLDRIYEIQQSSLESDAQLTLDKAMTWCAAEQDDVARRALKALALLELTQSEDNPTTAELVARCLYDRLDGASPKDEVEAALQHLAPQPDSEQLRAAGPVPVGCAAPLPSRKQGWLRNRK